MKFAEPWWLFGALLALVVAGIYVWGGLRTINATKKFGDPASACLVVSSNVTFRASRPLSTMVTGSQRKRVIPRREP